MRQTTLNFPSRPAVVAVAPTGTAAAAVAATHPSDEASSSLALAEINDLVVTLSHDPMIPQASRERIMSHVNKISTILSIPERKVKSPVGIV